MDDTGICTSSTGNWAFTGLSFSRKYTECSIPSNIIGTLIPKEAA